MEAQRPGFLASVWANPEGPSQLLSSLQDRLSTNINLHMNYHIFPGGTLFPVPLSHLSPRDLKADPAAPQLKALPGFPLFFG